MKPTRSTFTWAIVAFATLACISALVGHPVANYIPPDVLAALGAAGAMPFMTGETRTLQDQIKRLQDTRTAKALEMEGVQNKALNEGRTKDESEREAFKGLAADIAQIDAELEDLRSLEALQVTKAVPAVGGAGAAPGAVARGALATGGAPAIHMNKDADEKFKGQNYTRIVIAKALSRLSDGDVSPLAIAEARWGRSNPTLLNVMKAAVPGGGTGAGEWGAELAAIDQRYTGDFIEYLHSQTVYDKLPLRQIPANVQIKGQDGAATAYWVGQSKAIPATTADFFNVNLTPLKVAALAVVSNELLRDSSPAAEQLVRDALVEASSQRVDNTFLSAAAAVLGISPAGILNGLAGIPSAGTDGAGLRADIKALYAPFIAAKNVNGLQLVTTPSLAKSIQLMTNALGLTEFPTISATGGTLLGDTVTTGDNVGAGLLCAVAVAVEVVWVGVCWEGVGVVCDGGGVLAVSSAEAAEEGGLRLAVAGAGGVAVDCGGAVASFLAAVADSRTPRKNRLTRMCV